MAELGYVYPSWGLSILLLHVGVIPLCGMPRLSLDSFRASCHIHAWETGAFPVTVAILSSVFDS